MNKIDVKKIDAKVKSVLVFMTILQGVFILGAIGSAIAMFSVIHTNALGAFLASCSAIGCLVYVVDFSNRKKLGEDRYRIIRHEYTQEQRADAYIAVLSKPIVAESTLDAIRYSMAGTDCHKVYPDTGNLTEDLKNKINSINEEAKVTAIADLSKPEECIVIPYDVFKSKMEQRQKRNAS